LPMRRIVSSQPTSAWRCFEEVRRACEPQARLSISSTVARRSCSRSFSLFACKVSRETAARRSSSSFSWRQVHAERHLVAVRPCRVHLYDYESRLPKRAQQFRASRAMPGANRDPLACSLAPAAVHTLRDSDWDFRRPTPPQELARSLWNAFATARRKFQSTLETLEILSSSCNSRNF